MREKYWILGGRITVRKNMECVISAGDLKDYPVVDPVLLVDRREDAAVFEVVGVYLAGPCT